MNPRTVASILSSLWMMTGFLMMFPLAFALFEHQRRTTLAYATAFMVTMLSACALRYAGRGAPSIMHRKDALGSVALAWIGLGVFGALPFILEGSIPHPVSAFFEAVSGFTTTGATVIPDVSRLSRATNLWRCLMHWIGGMGIVVLFVAIFPQLGVGAKHLFRTEVPGPITEGLRPQIKKTALALWWIYTAWTALATLLFSLAGMSWYDAVCHAFSALSTGGFSTKSGSIGSYHNASIDWLVAFFMLVGGINFALFYSVLKGRARELFTHYELRFYLLVNAAVIAILFFSIRARHPDMLTALRFATFQTVAITTTTGLSTEDFDTYPTIARFTLFLCMFMGGCAGSTAGGLKASRVYTLLKLAQQALFCIVRPSAVVPVRLGPHAVQSSILHDIAVYVTTFLLLFVVASLAMLLMGLDMTSATSAVMASLSSVGLGLGALGPSHHVAWLPSAGKFVLTFCMIAGRLEIFALFAIFMPEMWRK